MKSRPALGQPTRNSAGVTFLSVNSNRGSIPGTGEPILGANPVRPPFREMVTEDAGAVIRHYAFGQKRHIHSRHWHAGIMESLASARHQHWHRGWHGFGTGRRSASARWARRLPRWQGAPSLSSHSTARFSYELRNRRWWCPFDRFDH